MTLISRSCFVSVSVSLFVCVSRFSSLPLSLCLCLSLPSRTLSPLLFPLLLSLILINHYYLLVPDDPSSCHTNQKTSMARLMKYNTFDYNYHEREFLH